VLLEDRFHQRFFINQLARADHISRLIMEVHLERDEIG
jgi:hypothetical protein